MARCGIQGKRRCGLCHYRFPFNAHCIVRQEASIMAVTDIRPFLDMVPAVRESPGQSVWLTYDADADALYVHYKKPNLATDTELTDNDVILPSGGHAFSGSPLLPAPRR